jgi:hypothetical protein
MPRLRRFALLLPLLAVGLAVGCKSRWRPDGMDAGGSRPDGSGVVDTQGGLDASPDMGGSALGPCLDSPTDLPRPPSGRLPCELIPPGLRL